MKAKAGDFIEITKRKVSDKVQPHFKVGNIYHVNHIEKLKSGATVLVIDKDPKKHLTVRCNAERFEWKILTVLEVIEKNIQDDSKQIVSKLKESFTEQEQLRMSMIPVILYHVAWVHAEGAVKYAASHRLEQVKKLSRTVRSLRERYLAFLYQDLDKPHVMGIEKQTEDFMRIVHGNLQKLFYSSGNMVCRMNIGTDYMDLRAYAYVSILFIRECQRYEKERNETIAKEVGRASGTLPYLDELKGCMEAYLGDARTEDDKHITLLMDNLRKSIDNIEFNLTEE